MQRGKGKPVFKTEQLYLSWANNFISVNCFAEYYGLARHEALELIEKGRRLNHAR